MIREWVKAGALAGLVAGLVVGVITYATLPPVDVLIQELNASGQLPPNMGPEELRQYLEASLKISGVMAAVMTVALGAFMGLVAALIARAMRPVWSAVVAGALMIAILAGPNAALGGSVGKTVINLMTGLTYAAALTVIALGGGVGEGGEAEEGAA